MQNLKEKMQELHQASDEFTSIASRNLFVNGHSDIILSICPVHTTRATEADLWSLGELYNFYDNYSYTQIDEMQATGNYPLHFTALYRNGNQKTLLVDTDADVCLTSIEELVEMVEKRIAFKGIK